MDNPLNQDGRDADSSTAMVNAVAVTSLAILFVFSIPLMAANLFGCIKPECSATVRVIIAVVVLAVFIRLAIRWSNHWTDPHQGKRPPDAP
jgi:threonine/homoserine efflux transporter RhtA